MEDPSVSSWAEEDRTTSARSAPSAPASSRQAVRIASSPTGAPGARSADTSTNPDSTGSPATVERANFAAFAPVTAESFARSVSSDTTARFVS